MFVPTIKSILKEKIEQAKVKGINKSLKVMVVGVPNVGKSSFINRLSGGKKLKLRTDQELHEAISGLQFLKM